MSFWIGQKFPRISLCFLFELGNKRIGYFACEVQIFVNGQKASKREQYFLSVSGDLVWLYHQENLMDLNTYLLHEQNHVEVSCEIIDASKDAEVIIYGCGVHEYKEGEDVKKSTLWLHEISDELIQQFSSSIDSEMLEVKGCIAQKKVNATDIVSADTIHQNKEMSSFHIQLYGNDLWDPMLLESQLNCMNENLLPPNDDDKTSENKEFEPIHAMSLVHPTKYGSKAYEKVVHKEPSESHKIRMKSNGERREADDNMEAFYAALHAETYLPPSSSPLEDNKDFSKLVYPQMSEETKKALEILKELFSKQVCPLLEPTSSTSMTTTLKYLCTLFTDDDDVSLSLKSLIVQLSADFTEWSCDYSNASMKLVSSTAGLSKLEKLEEGVVANKNQFGEFVSIENELESQLVYLKERMKELEEQINAINVNISISAMARDTAIRMKRETFMTGKMLKDQRDELRKRRPRLRAEQESARATKAYIEDEWSKIREKFDRIVNNFGLDY